MLGGRYASHLPKRDLIAAAFVGVIGPCKVNERAVAAPAFCPIAPRRPPSAWARAPNALALAIRPGAAAFAFASPAAPLWAILLKLSAKASVSSVWCGSSVTWAAAMVTGAPRTPGTPSRLLP